MTLDSQQKIREALDDCDAVISAISKQWSHPCVVLPQELMKVRSFIIQQLVQLQIDQFDRG
ncbi:MAG TPA: hypothetical protein VHA37_01915 [Candidatus Saccharimonadales bacterium]|nr:hypothetical protein [Candidatus Saccharimonadales bacterium]